MKKWIIAALEFGLITDMAATLGRIVADYRYGILIVDLGILSRLISIGMLFGTANALDAPITAYYSLVLAPFPLLHSSVPASLFETMVAPLRAGVGAAADNGFEQSPRALSKSHGLLAWAKEIVGTIWLFLSLRRADALPIIARRLGFGRAQPCG